MSEAQATRIVAIRHGETDWNAGSRIQGQLDIGLNATGMRQAGRLAAALAHEPIDAVHSSDLRRARETAWPFSSARALPVATDAGLRERAFGAFEGLTYAEIAQRWPDGSERWRRRDPAFGAPGGETLAAFYARAVACVARLAAGHAGQTIAVVTHGGVLDCLYRAATRLALDAPRSWQLANAGINRLLYTPQGFTLVGWGDVGHLDPSVLDEPDAAVPAQPAERVA